MRLLAEVGLQLSAELVPASEANPDGHFEDVQIRDVQQRFMKSLSLSPYLPRPAGWRESPDYRTAVRHLTELVAAANRRHDGVWGFKDPRTCVLWPLWQEVWAAIGIEARPVFCVREGTAVINSMMATYGLSQDVAEGIYVYRIFHSLQDVTEGWFFVQYPEWRRTPAAQLAELATYCGLGTDGADHESVVASVYRPELERHSTGASLAVSGLVSEADELLAQCSGMSYDQGQIDAWCASVERRMADFGFVFAGVTRLAADRKQRQTSWRRVVRRGVDRLRR